MNFFLAILGLSAAVKPEFPEQICNSLMTISGPSPRQPFPLVLKMTELINTIDEASEFSRQGHIANFEDITSLFNVTDFAVRDAGRALFAYTGRLSPSLDIIIATACTSLQIIDRSPPLRQRVRARVRDFTGYNHAPTNYRDTRHFMIDHTKDLVQKRTFELSQLYNESTRALTVLNGHVRALGKLVGHHLQLGALQTFGRAETEHSLQERCSAIAFHLMADARSLATRTQIDLISYEGVFGVKGLFETPHYSSTLPAREALRALIVRCHSIRQVLVG